MHFNKNKHFIFPSRRISFLPWKVHFPLTSHTRLGPQQGVDIKHNLLTAKRHVTTIQFTKGGKHYAEFDQTPHRDYLP